MASLYEIGEMYAESHAAISTRIQELRQAAKKEWDPAERKRLMSRIRELTPIQRDLSELKDICMSYYIKGVNRHVRE